MTMLCFSFPLLVKCLSLQPYLVIIPTRNSGEIILLILLQILQIQQIHQILQHPQLAFTLRTPIHQAGVTWRSLGSLQLYQSRETISGVSLSLLLVNHCDQCILLSLSVQRVYNLHNPWRVWILGQPGASPSKVNVIDTIQKNVTDTRKTNFVFI